MKFYVSIVVHQSDSAYPDYQHLHESLKEAGFIQRGLDGLLTQQPTSGLYQREETVLTRADVEFDLQVVLDSFPHRCSFQLEQAAGTVRADQASVSFSRRRFAEAVRTSECAGVLIH